MGGRSADILTRRVLRQAIADLSEPDSADVQHVHDSSRSLAPRKPVLSGRRETFGMP